MSSVNQWGKEGSALKVTLTGEPRLALTSIWHVTVAEGKRVWQSTKWLIGLCLEVTHFFPCHWPK